MAFRVFSFLMVFAMAFIGVDSCQITAEDTIRLVEFKVMQYGIPVQSLPLAGVKKGVSVKVGVYVTETLNQKWFSSTVSLKAIATLNIFNWKRTIKPGCILKTCEFSQLSCQTMQQDLGIADKIGCPVKGPKLYTATVALEVPDLSSDPSIPRWALNYVKTVEAFGTLAIRDDTGKQIGCIKTSFIFTHN